MFQEIAHGNPGAIRAPPFVEIAGEQIVKRHEPFVDQAQDDRRRGGCLAIRKVAFAVGKPAAKAVFDASRRLSWPSESS